VALEYNKVEDGNITRSIGEFYNLLSFPNECGFVLRHFSHQKAFNRSPEPHILLFRRPLGTDPQSGRVDPELERKAREEYRSQYGMARN